MLATRSFRGPQYTIKCEEPKLVGETIRTCDPLVSVSSISADSVKFRDCDLRTFQSVPVGIHAVK
jgi:hypothetical protein